MRDHRRAVMVGERSYGKGSVQGIFPLNLSHSGLRLTTAKFYSPNGLPFSKVGVEPDVVVHQVAKPVVDGDIATNQQSALVADAMLAQALTIAQSNIARK